MKKTCFAVGHPKYYVGGAEVHSLALAKKFCDRGYGVVYLNPIHNDISFPRVEIVDGVKLYNYRTGGHLRVLEYRKIRPILSEIDGDIFYVRASPFVEGFLARYAKRKGRNCVWQCAMGRALIKFYKTKELLASGGLLSIAANLSNAFSEDVLRHYAIRNSSCVIAQTEKNVSLFQERFGRESVLIRKGIHIEPGESEDKDRETIRVVFLRSIKKHSRAQLFAELAERFKDDHRLRFIAMGPVGNGFQHVLEMFKRSKVDYLGRLDHEKVLRILAESHVLVDTLEETGGVTTYSNTFLEAWSKKMVVFSFGTNPDNVLERRKIGHFVESVDDCAAKLKALADNPEILREMGDRAFSYVKEHHNLEKEVNDLIELFESGQP